MPCSGMHPEVAMSSKPRRVHVVIPLAFGFALVLVLEGGWLS